MHADQTLPVFVLSGPRTLLSSVSGSGSGSVCSSCFQQRLSHFTVNWISLNSGLFCAVIEFSDESSFPIEFTALYFRLIVHITQSPNGNEIHQDFPTFPRMLTETGHKLRGESKSVTSAVDLLQMLFFLW